MNPQIDIWGEDENGYSFEIRCKDILIAESKIYEFSSYQLARESADLFLKWFNNDIMRSLK